MTTARARFLKRRLCRGFDGLDYRSLGRLALGDGPIDEPNQDDHAKRELVDRNVAEEVWDRDLGQSAERRVLAAHRGVPRPQEVDLHRDAPNKAEEVYDRAPPARTEMSPLLRPSPPARH